MSTTSKSLALSHELADIIKKRLPALAVSEGFDASSDGPHPTILVGAGTAGSESMFVRVKPIDWSLSQNVIGQTSQVYTPNVIQIVTEANAAATLGCGFFSLADILPLLGEILSKGTKVEWYQSANTNPVDVSDIVSGNLKASFQTSLYWGMLSGS